MKIILVESKNDKAFYTYLIKRIFCCKALVEEIEAKQTCKIQEMSGKDNLRLKLEEIKERYKAKEEDTDGKLIVGVIIDRDDDEIEHRKQDIEKTFDSVFADMPTDAKLISYIFDDNYKEIEYYLKAKKNKDSTFADCIFNSCRDGISEKDLMKEWVRLYLKNACDKKTKKSNNEDCLFQRVFECERAADFFDFKVEDLPRFKIFLNYITENKD